MAATESKPIMSNLKAHLSLLGLSFLPLASAQAQEYVDKGLYASQFDSMTATAGVRYAF